MIKELSFLKPGALAPASMLDATLVTLMMVFIHYYKVSPVYSLLSLHTCNLTSFSLRKHCICRFLCSHHGFCQLGTAILGVSETVFWFWQTFFPILSPSAFLLAMFSGTTGTHSNMSSAHLDDRTSDFTPSM